MELELRRQVTRQRRRRDVPGAGRRPRRADPPRGQRALLGEGARQEPRARLPPGGRRARRAEEARGRRRPRRALPRRGEPRRARSTRATSTTGSHSERVADLAARIAERMDLDPEQVELVAPRRRASRPRQARRPGGDPAQARAAHRARSGSCSSATRRSATACSRASASTRSPIGCSTTTSAGTAPAIRTGLHGDDIPLGARIIFVADAFDAMTNDRVYREKLTIEDGARRARGVRRHAVRSAGGRGLDRRSGPVPAGVTS